MIGLAKVTITSQQLKLWFTKPLPMSNLAHAMVSVSAHRVCGIAKNSYLVFVQGDTSVLQYRYFFTELVLLK